MNYGQLSHLLQALGYKREVIRGSHQRFYRKGHFLLFQPAKASARLPEYAVVATRFHLDQRGLLPIKLWAKRVAKYSGVTTYR